MASPERQGPRRLAVAGKGGAGKSFIAGTLARVLARRGARVLALDSDFVPGLALSLGAEEPEIPPLLDAAEWGEDERWRLKPGIGPARAAQRFATDAPDGVRLLQAGKIGRDGQEPIMGAMGAFRMTVHGIGDARAFAAWTLLGDLPAGPRHPAYRWAPYARNFLIVVEPEWKSILTARRVARIVSARPGVTVSAVASKVSGREDIELISARLGAPIFAAVPADDDVRDAERARLAPIDAVPDCPAVRAVEDLAHRLELLAARSD